MYLKWQQHCSEFHCPQTGFTRVGSWECAWRVRFLHSVQKGKEFLLAPLLRRWPGSMSHACLLVPSICPCFKNGCCTHHGDRYFVFWPLQRNRVDVKEQRKLHVLVADAMMLCFTLYSRFLRHCHTWDAWSRTWALDMQFAKWSCTEGCQCFMF